MANSNTGYPPYPYYQQSTPAPNQQQAHQHHQHQATGSDPHSIQRSQLLSQTGVGGATAVGGGNPGGGRAFGASQGYGTRQDNQDYFGLQQHQWTGQNAAYAEETGHAGGTQAYGSKTRTAAFNMSTDSRASESPPDTSSSNLRQSPDISYQQQKVHQQSHYIPLPHQSYSGQHQTTPEQSRIMTTNKNTYDYGSTIPPVTTAAQTSQSTLSQAYHQNNQSNTGYGISAIQASNAYTPSLNSTHSAYISPVQQASTPYLAASNAQNSSYSQNPSQTSSSSRVARIATPNISTVRGGYQAAQSTGTDASSHNVEQSQALRRNNPSAVPQSSVHQTATTHYSTYPQSQSGANLTEISGNQVQSHPYEQFSQTPSVQVPSSYYQTSKTTGNTSRAATPNPVPATSYRVTQSYGATSTQQPNPIHPVSYPSTVQRPQVPYLNTEALPNKSKSHTQVPPRTLTPPQPNTKRSPNIQQSSMNQSHIHPQPHPTASHHTQAQIQQLAHAQQQAQAQAELKAQKQAQVAQAKAQAKAQAAQAQAQARALAQAQEQAQAQAQARVQAQAQAAQAQAQAIAQAKAKKALAESQARARAEAESRARAEAEARARAEAEERARAEAEERARAEAEERARAEAEEKAMAEAEERRRAEAEERERIQAEQRAREVQAKAQAEAQARAQAEERARAEAEARASAQAEERARAEAEAWERAQAEKQAKAEAQARAEAEARNRESTRYTQNYSQMQSESSQGVMHSSESTRSPQDGSGSTSKGNVVSYETAKPPVDYTEMEKHMREMVERMREYQTLDPTGFISVWENVKKNGLLSNTEIPSVTPESQESVNRNSNRFQNDIPTSAPSASNENTSMSGPVSRRTGQQSDGSSNIRMQSDHWAQGGTSQNQNNADTHKQHERDIPANTTLHPGQPPPDQSSNNSHVWPESQKLTLAQCASSYMAAYNPHNKPLPIDYVVNILNTDPSFVVLCERLEYDGYDFERSALARAMLDATPPITDNRSKNGTTAAEINGNNHRNR
ncbi:hypothetical protein DFH27DRAFT_393642 [Peziza echinospora]|nr:hypothetical protein DFH27DRAFT_393642 [Peziza echinospora]